MRKARGLHAYQFGFCVPEHFAEFPVHLDILAVEGSVDDADRRLVERRTKASLALPNVEIRLQQIARPRVDQHLQIVPMVLQFRFCPGPLLDLALEYPVLLPQGPRDESVLLRQRECDAHDDQRDHRDRDCEKYWIETSDNRRFPACGNANRRKHAGVVHTRDSNAHDEGSENPVPYAGVSAPGD
jgi:hypothetical protein